MGINRLRLALALPLLALSKPIGAQAPAGRWSGCEALLVVEKGDAALAALDPETGKVLWRAAAGKDPHEVVVAADGSRAFVSNYGGPESALHSLAVFDLRKGKAVRPIDIAPLRSPHGLLAKGGAVWFTAETAKAIARLDLASGKVDWVMGTGQDRTHILAGGTGETMVAANAASASISVVEPAQLQFGSGPPRQGWQVSTVKTGDGTQGLDITPDGSRAWVAASREGSVAVVDLATKQVMVRIPLPFKSGNRLKLTRDGGIALIGSEQLVAIDTETRQVRTIEIGRTRSEGLLVTPQGKHLFAALPQENRIVRLTLPDLRIDGSIATGKSPDGMACASAPNRRAKQN